MKLNQTPAATAYLRCERKFLPDGLSLAELLSLVRHHPAMFRETYAQRTVNNLYFDTPDLRHFRDHLDGAAHRVKIRVRWYGELRGLAEKPVLEFKTRHGAASSKAAYALPALEFDGDFRRARFEAAFRWHSVPKEAGPHLHGLELSLANRYHRRYLCSADGTVRLTLDWGLEFLALRSSNGSLRALPHDGPMAILELKYDQSHAGEAARVANEFPFRLTRCSKYVLGVRCLNGV